MCRCGNEAMSGRRFSIYLLSRDSTDEVKLKLSLDGSLIRCLVDTGVAVTLVNGNEVWWRNKKWPKSDVILKSYNGDRIPVSGKAVCAVRIGDKSAKCDIFVVPKRRLVLGRNALARLGVRIVCARRTCRVNAVQEETAGYPGIFSESGLCERIHTHGQTEADRSVSTAEVKKVALIRTRQAEGGTHLWRADLWTLLKLWSGCRLWC